MRRLPQTISLLAVSIFTMGVVAVAPVAAHNGSDDSSSTTTSVDSGTATGGGRSSGSSGSSIKTSTSTKTESEHESENETEVEHETEVHATTDVGSLRSQAKQLLETKRQEGKTKSVEARQKSCDAHKAELTKRSENYARNAKKHLDVFNSIYAKVLAYQKDKNLTADNFDTLKATADAKKDVAQKAVDALSDPSLASIDCTSADPAQNVASLKTAVANARQALHDYRVAIKDVVVALQATKATTDDSTKPATNTTETN